MQAFAGPHSRCVMDKIRISVVSSTALLALTATASAGPMTVPSAQVISSPIQIEQAHYYYRHHYRHYGWHRGWHYGWYHHRYRHYGYRYYPRYYGSSPGRGGSGRCSWLGHPSLRAGRRLALLGYPYYLADPVCCQYDESVIICRKRTSWLSNNASRFSAGFSR